MIVCVESNFTLELAYRQEQHASCEELLTLAESKKVSLVIPAFCLSEPYDAFVRRYKRRRLLLQRLQKETRELGRSATYGSVRDESAAVSATFGRSLDEEKERLDSQTLRLLRCCETIPTTAPVLQEALEVQKAGLFRGPHDAMVFASVQSYLRGAGEKERCFLNRNRKDFLDPDVEAALLELGCRIISGFDNGVAYIKSRLTRV